MADDFDNFDGVELKIARLRAHMRQELLAQKSSIERARLSRIENNWVKPRPDEFDRLEKILGVTLHEEAVNAAEE